MATAAMINNKVTTKDWFLGFTLPPKDNSIKDYTNMSIAGIAPWKILYISLINPFDTASPVRASLFHAKSPARLVLTGAMAPGPRSAGLVASLDVEAPLALTRELALPGSDLTPGPLHE
jgi:hypothetical protein